MKLLFEEHDAVAYSEYKFPYCVYAIKEQKDAYSSIYEKGFLPYTNNLAIDDEIYYLARSIRIDLQTSLFNSKQKNILNKFAKQFDPNSLSFCLENIAELAQKEAFRTWCIENAKDGFLSSERLDYILSRPYLQQILTITYHEKVLAQLFVVSEAKSFVHVWYSFYDLSVTLNDFGKWILLQAIRWSQQQGYAYFYIGTCYSKSALYKLSLSPFTTYYNGNAWNENVSELKKKLLGESV